MTCNICYSNNVGIKHSSNGAALIIKTMCSIGHSYTWRSQENTNKQPLLNVRLAASLYSTGINFSVFQTFANTFGLQFISHDTFYRIVKHFVAPAIAKTWEDHKQNLWSTIKSSNRNIWIAGDGQFDSPGFCAKYVVYSIMNLHSNQIVDFEIVQKGQVTGELEKAACQKVLHRLQNSDFNVELFLSDRHRGIRCMLRNEFPQVRHQFDVWHLAKSLAKKLKGVEKMPCYFCMESEYR